MSRDFDISVQVFASDEATHNAARREVEELFGVISPPERTGWQEDSTFCCELAVRLGDVRSIRGLTRGVSETVPDAYIFTRWAMIDSDCGHFLFHAGQEVESERREMFPTADGTDVEMVLVERNGIRVEMATSRPAAEEVSNKADAQQDPDPTEAVVQTTELTANRAGRQHLLVGEGSFKNVCGFLVSTSRIGGRQVLGVEPEVMR